MVGLAFIASLLSFRHKYAYHLRAFSVLLGITFFTEMIARSSSTLHISRNAVYNVFMLIEFPWYAWYYRQILRAGWPRRALRVFGCALPVLWLLFFWPLSRVVNWSGLFAAIVVASAVCMAMAYCYQLLTSDDDIALNRHPELWIATGMLFLYLCQVPYYGGVMGYLNVKDRAMSTLVLNVMMMINAAMYLVFIYAFLCPRQPNRS
jgi:hypothetical protein